MNRNGAAWERGHGLTAMPPLVLSRHKAARFGNAERPLLLRSAIIVMMQF